MAFGDCGREYELSVDCYNYKTVRLKKKEICVFLFKESEHVEESFFELVGLNDQFLFVASYPRKYAYYTEAIFLFLRKGFNKLYKCFTADCERWFVYNEEICGRTCSFDEGCRTLICVYDIKGAESNGKSEILSGGEASEIGVVYASGKKYIYSKDVDLEDSILKFKHY